MYLTEGVSMSTASTIKSLAAYDLIRDMILSGEALPGTRLVLVDLEKKLGVGRGPIRDALMRLDKSGLVQNIPYKGAIVMMPPSSKEIEHIFNLRIQVECALAKEAMQQATAEDMNSWPATWPIPVMPTFSSTRTGISTCSSTPFRGCTICWPWTATCWTMWKVSSIPAAILPKTSRSSSSSTKTS